jgi:hypothetical protein
MRKLAVINHFQGQVDWIKNLKFEYILYNKFDPQISIQYWKTGQENTQEYYKRLFGIPNYLEIMKPVSTNIPNLVSNVGHDAFTFFTHIINHYDDLADLTIFLHSTPFHHYHGGDFVEMLNGIDEIVDFTDFGQSMDSASYFLIKRFQRLSCLHQDLSFWYRDQQSSRRVRLFMSNVRG